MARVELRGLSKTYPGGIEAVAPIDLEVADGESLTIVGPSGSGKSTLLRLVAGLESPTSGELWIDGRRADRLPPHRRDVAMVFQDQMPLPHLSVSDNLAFGLRARGWRSAEVRARVGEVAGLLGLSDLLGRMPRALSGGQRRRVALGRALARRPAILLLDEPLTGLDAPLRLAARAELSDLQRRLGTTTLHVTHDQDDALALGDRVAALDRGRLAQVGPPRELYDRPATRFVGQFIGSPPMGILPAEVAFEAEMIRLRLPDAGPSATVAADRRTTAWATALDGRPPGPVDLGIRPEHVMLAEGVVNEGSPTVLPIRGEVRRVEPLGHESWATLAIGPHRLVLRVPPSTRLAVGDTAAVRLDLDRAAWFDPKSGDRVGSSD